MKTKIYVVIFVMFIIVISLCGCSTTVYGLSGGTYAVEDETNMPQIQFDLSEYDGSWNGYFCYSTGNQSIEGIINIDKGDVICTSQEGEAEYVFEILDNDTITFNLKRSSALYMEDGITQIQDGTEFIYVDEY